MPTTTPATCTPWVVTPKKAAPATSVMTGMPLFIIPAMEESIQVWASGKRLRGIAIQRKPRRRSLGWSDLSTGRRADGTMAMNARPRTGRNHATRPGCSTSRATSMNRKEEPQIPAAVTISNQSKGAIWRCSNDVASGGGVAPGIGAR